MREGGDNMLYNAMEVADYIINKCYEEDKPVSNLQLQKVLFFAWIDYYKQIGKSLFGDLFCAWQFGPVIPIVYHEYCVYGGRPINIKCETEIKKDDAKILDVILSNYVDVPVNILVDMTHRKDSAWDRVFQGGLGNRNVIPFELIVDVECGGEYVS